jgi:hypothetical protein
LDADKGEKGGLKRLLWLYPRPSALIRVKKAFEEILPLLPPPHSPVSVSGKFHQERTA